MHEKLNKIYKLLMIHKELNLTLIRIEITKINKEKYDNSNGDPKN
jgi:hypothetical protein